MQAVYIRHNLGSTPEILERLWGERRIAVHYGGQANNPKNKISVDPYDYFGEGKKALERLWQYCEAGATVGATYRDIRPAHMLVGTIEKGSEIIGTYKYGPEFPYKIVQLRNTVEVSYKKYPVLAAIQPRRGTVTGWPSAEKILQSIFENRPLPSNVASLAPSQLEVICYEYLRMKRIIKALLLPIGRTLRDVDIYGLDDLGNNIIAQVTHGRFQSQVKHKLNVLEKRYSPSAALFFFGPERYREERANVQYVSIESVFSALDSGQAGDIYHRLISNMLHRE